MAEQKYYWLKLKKDFFKRHDIQIIEAMPNGKDYVLFYLKLLLESIDHEGALRFSDTVPYNETMLSVITNTNVDIVKSAMKLFQQLGMVEVMDNQTIYMAEVNKMLGSETKWAEKKRMARQKRDNVPTLSPPCPHDVRQEIEIEKELEIELEKDDKSDPVAAVIAAYANKINPSPSERCRAELSGFAQRMGADVCLRAIDVALDERKTGWAYIRGILRAKEQQGVKCLADWDKVEAERQPAPAEKEHHRTKREPTPEEQQRANKKAQEDMDFLRRYMADLKREESEADGEYQSRKGC